MCEKVCECVFYATKSIYPIGRQKERKGEGEGKGESEINAGW